MLLTPDFLGNASFKLIKGMGNWPSHIEGSPF